MDIVFKEVIDYIKEMNIDKEIYNNFINSELAVLVITIAFLKGNKVSKKEIITAITNSELVKALSDYKVQGLKNKLYHFMIMRKQITLIYLIYIIKEKLKYLKNKMIKGDEYEKN